MYKCLILFAIVTIARDRAKLLTIHQIVTAADYPSSASAQFGIGRALQAAGDKDGAAQAFRKALALDPQFEKATDGLNALR